MVWHPDRFSEADACQQRVQWVVSGRDTINVFLHLSVSGGGGCCRCHRRSSGRCRVWVLHPLQACSARVDLSAGIKGQSAMTDDKQVPLTHSCLTSLSAYFAKILAISRTVPSETCATSCTSLVVLPKPKSMQIK